LHPQINIAHTADLWFSEIERAETSQRLAPHRYAVCATRSAGETGSRDSCALLPVEGPVQQACTAEEWCMSSFCAGVQRSGSQPHSTNAAKCVAGQMATLATRSLCELGVAGSMRVAKRALIHDSLTHHIRMTGACPHRPWKWSGAPSYSRYLRLYKAWPVPADGSAHRGAMACRLQRFVACVDLERSLDRPLIARPC